MGKVILTINKETNWPVREPRGTRFQRTQHFKVYTHLKHMAVGDIVSVPVATKQKATSLQCSLCYYRKHDGQEQTIGYKTEIVTKNGGTVVFIRRCDMSEMRKAGKPYSRTPKTAKQQEIKLSTLPPLPHAPQVVSPETREGFASQNV